MDMRSGWSCWASWLLDGSAERPRSVVTRVARGRRPRVVGGPLLLLTLTRDGVVSTVPSSPVPVLRVLRTLSPSFERVRAGATFFGFWGVSWVGSDAANRSSSSSSSSSLPPPKACANPMKESCEILDCTLRRVVLVARRCRPLLTLRREDAADTIDWSSMTSLPLPRSPPLLLLLISLSDSKDFCSAPGV